ncbi:MAG: DUF2269 family protein [Gemmatimonadota bacterium]|nr:MAG: DUF2269 family protein [Gemmatimonadota bacterium]
MAERIWVFFHLMGMAFWLGGMFTVSLWTSRARKSGDLQLTAFAFETARRIYRGVVLIAAWLSVLSGGVLMVVTERAWFRPYPEHWIFQMQILGLFAVLVTMLFVVPNSSALARLAARAAAEGETSEEFKARVRNQGVVGSLIGVLLVYLVLMGAVRF